MCTALHQMSKTLGWVQLMVEKKRVTTMQLKYTKTASTLTLPQALSPADATPLTEHLRTALAKGKPLKINATACTQADTLSLQALVAGRQAFVAADLPCTCTLSAEVANICTRLGIQHLLIAEAA